jgi:hypothetical protein
MIDEYTPDRCLAITVSRRVCASRAFTPQLALAANDEDLL